MDRLDGGKFRNLIGETCGAEWYMETALDNEFLPQAEI